MNTEPRIYVACLASYNAGRLHGCWINASADVDDMQAEIAAMLRASPCPNVTVQCPECEGDGEGCSVCHGKGEVPSAEEWAIHDYEGLGGDLGEYAGLEEVARRAAAIDVADEHGIPLAVLIEYARDKLSRDWNADELADAVQDNYKGTTDSWADFAQDFCEDVYDMREVPDWLKGHIDWETVGRDLRLGGDFDEYTHNGTMYFFWGH